MGDKTIGPIYREGILASVGLNTLDYQASRLGLGPVKFRRVAEAIFCMVLAVTRV